MCGDIKQQIYAIFLHFSRVGRGSGQKNPVKIMIARWLLGIIGVLRFQPVAKIADFLGNPGVFKNQKMEPVGDPNLAS